MARLAPAVRKHFFGQRYRQGQTRPADHGACKLDQPMTIVDKISENITHRCWENIKKNYWKDCSQCWQHIENIAHKCCQNMWTMFTEYVEKIVHSTRGPRRLGDGGGIRLQGAVHPWAGSVFHLHPLAGPSSSSLFLIWTFSRFLSLPSSSFALYFRRALASLPRLYTDETCQQWHRRWS